MDDFNEKISEINIERVNLKVEEFQIPDWPFDSKKTFWLGFLFFSIIKSGFAGISKSFGLVYVKIDHFGNMTFKVLPWWFLLSSVMIIPTIVSAIVVDSKLLIAPIVMFLIFFILATIFFIVDYVDRDFRSNDGTAENRATALFLFNQCKRRIYKKVKTEADKSNKTYIKTKEELKKFADVLMENVLDK